MMSEWKEYKLTEVGSLKRGKSKHRPRYAFHLYGGPYPFIQTGQIREASKYITKYEQTYSEAGLAQSKLWNKGTLCITIAANIAEIAILSFDACFPDSVIGFIPDKKKCDLDFSFYTLKYFQKELQSHGTGSVQDNINLGTFEKIKFPFPPLPEQQSIASMLSSLDDKIDLLQRQNKTLEQLAETLFRQWFVEEAEESWEIYTLNDLTSLITDGKHGDCKDEEDSNYYFVSVKDINNGKINYKEARQITKNDFDETDKRTRFTSGDTLITNSGTIGRMALATNIPQTRKTTFQKSVAILKPKFKVAEPFFFYSLLKSENKNLIELAGGTTQSNLLLGDLRKYEVKYPGYSLVKEYEIKVTPIFNKILFNDNQIKTLTQLRDALLPKLMSGEVRVN